MILLGNVSRLRLYILQEAVEHAQATGHVNFQEYK